MSYLLKHTLPAGLILILLALASASALAALDPPPKALAIVVDCAAGLQQIWEGESRQQSLQKALATELKTLPLRANVGLWLAQDGKATQVFKSLSALEARGRPFNLPPGAGGGSPAPALAQAQTWLESQGGGGLVFIAASDSPAQPAALPAAAPDVFFHVVDLLPPTPGPQSRDYPLSLALAGGGGYFPVSAAARLSAVLHSAIVTALSETILLVPAYDADNNPLSLLFSINRRDIIEQTRLARSHRQVQLLPGGYGLQWPADPRPAPRQPPDNVQLPGPGLTRLWAGGQGYLNLTALDGQGASLPWQVTVSSIEKGDVEAVHMVPPLRLTLPSGRYQVRNKFPAYSWVVEIKAAEDSDLLLGPPAKLNLKLPAPPSVARLAYQALSLATLGRPASGYANSPFQLMPGPYSIRLETVPPREENIVLPPGQEVELPLKPIGALLVKPALAGQRLQFIIYDQQEKALASAQVGRAIAMLPGKYALVFPSQNRRVEVEIKAMETSTIQAQN